MGAGGVQTIKVPRSVVGGTYGLGPSCGVTTMSHCTYGPPRPPCVSFWSGSCPSGERCLGRG